jgi:gas vesicle structural protein
MWNPVLIDQKGRGNTNLIDVLDRVLDKGIVIDAWVRVALVAIDLMTIEARILVASIETYLEHAYVVAKVIQAPTMPPSRQIGSGRAKNQ